MEYGICHIPYSIFHMTRDYTSEFLLRRLGRGPLYSKHMVRINTKSALHVLILLFAIVGAQVSLRAQSTAPPTPGAPKAPPAQADACPAIPFNTPFDHEFSRG